MIDMKYDCFESESTCGECAYYLPYYLFYDDKYFPALEGQCTRLRKRRPGAATPACEKFSPADADT